MVCVWVVGTVWYFLTAVRDQQACKTEFTHASLPVLPSCKPPPSISTPATCVHVLLVLFAYALCHATNHFPPTHPHCLALALPPAWPQALSSLEEASRSAWMGSAPEFVRSRKEKGERSGVWNSQGLSGPLKDLVEGDRGAAK